MTVDDDDDGETSRFPFSCLYNSFVSIKFCSKLCEY